MIPPRQKIFIVCLITITFLLLFLGLKKVNRTACPDCNIILISIDTLRADHLGVYGYKKSTSPNLDRKATEAIVFDRAFSAAPWTLPSHAAMLTSKYPHKLGVQSISDKLPQSAYTIQEHLKTSGYKTAAFSGGPFVAKKFGFDQGFDFFTSNEAKLQDAPFVFSEAENFLEENKNKKFFLFLHTFEVHDPYSPPENISKQLDPYYKGSIDSISIDYIASLAQGKISPSTSELQRMVSLYDAEIRHLDIYLGRLFNKIDELRLKNRTVIVITSDHGEEFGERGLWGVHAYSLYNELIRAPLIIFSPNIKAGRNKTLTSSIDIAPSILDLAGISIPEEFEGESFLTKENNSPILSATQTNKNLLLENLGRSYATYENLSPVEGKNTNLAKTAVAVLKWPFKLIKHANQEEELFNLEEDPKEKNNLVERGIPSDLISDLERLTGGGEGSPGASQGGESSSSIALETEIAPVLYPHEHRGGDSVYDPKHYGFKNSKVWKVPYDLWITSIKPEIENAPTQVIHHGTIAVLNEKDQICPSLRNKNLKPPYTTGAVKKIYSVSSDTYNPWIISGNYGIFLKKGTPVVLISMLHNPEPPVGPGGIYKNVRLKVILGISRDAKNLKFKPLEYYKLHLDDKPCTGAEEQEVFTVPPRTKTFVKKAVPDPAGNPGQFIFNRSGTIIGLGGHFHPWQGGEKVSVFINDRPHTEFYPRLTTRDPWSWRILSNVRGIRINKGDKISISATYSNPNDYPVRGAMGMLGIIFAPD